MRVTARVPLPEGFRLPPGHRFDPAQLPALRDPSTLGPVGRVTAVTVAGDGSLEVHCDIEDAALRAYLGSARGVF